MKIISVRCFQRFRYDTNRVKYVVFIHDCASACDKLAGKRRETSDVTHYAPLWREIGGSAVSIRERLAGKYSRRNLNEKALRLTITEDITYLDTLGLSVGKELSDRGCLWQIWTWSRFPATSGDTGYSNWRRHDTKKKKTCEPQDRTLCVFFFLITGKTCPDTRYWQIRPVTPRNVTHRLSKHLHVFGGNASV